MAANKIVTVIDGVPGVFIPLRDGRIETDDPQDGQALMFDSAQGEFVNKDIDYNDIDNTPDISHRFEGDALLVGGDAVKSTIERNVANIDNTADGNWIEEGSSSIKRIIGNGCVVFNQMTTRPSSAYTYGGVTYTPNPNDDGWILNGTCTAVTTNAQFRMSSVHEILGHKYFQKIEADVTLINTNVGSVSFQPGNFRVFTAAKNGNPYYRLSGVVGKTYDNYEVHPVMVDLTLMFGEGNEPTAEEFDNMFPGHWLRNTGEIIGTRSVSLKSIGVNLYNNTTGKALLKAGTYIIEGTYTSLEYKSANGLYTIVPTVDPNGMFEVDYDGTLTVVGGDNATCIHKNSTDSGFKAYSEDVTTLNLTTITGKSEGSSTSVTLFERGLLSIGNVYDEIFADSDGVARTAIRRIGLMAYTSGDESDTSVITDGTMTAYVLGDEEVFALDNPIDLTYAADGYGLEINDTSNLPSLPLRFFASYRNGVVNAISTGGHIRDIEDSRIQGIDNIPTEGSENVITSDAVYKALQNIPAQEQSDWNESDTTDPAFIKNKPTNVSAFDNDAGYLTQHQTMRTVNHEQLTDSSLGDANLHDGFYFPNAVKDADGNWYGAVVVGDQVWMAENLRTTKYPDGTPISAGGSVPYLYDFSSSDIPLKKRGLLYLWNAVMNGANSSNSIPSGVQGIAPTGWHIPSWAEFDKLRNYVNNQNRYKSNGINHYIAKSLCSTEYIELDGSSDAPGNNLKNNNATGFTAIPGSRYAPSVGFGTDKQVCYMWTCSEYTSNTAKAHQFYLSYNYAAFTSAENPKSEALSVRCVSDLTPVQFRNWYVRQYGSLQHRLDEVFRCEMLAQLPYGTMQGGVSYADIQSAINAGKTVFCTLYDDITDSTTVLISNIGTPLKLSGTKVNNNVLYCFEATFGGGTGSGEYWNVQYKAIQTSSQLPALSGNEDKMLSVNSSGDGVEWKEPFSGSYSDLTNKPVNANFGTGVVHARVDNTSATINVPFSDYSLLSGGLVSIKFKNDVVANAKLNINNKGAYQIWFRNGQITAGAIKAGDRCLFMFNPTSPGYYILVSNDRWGEGV